MVGKFAQRKGLEAARFGFGFGPSGGVAGAKALFARFFQIFLCRRYIPDNRIFGFRLRHVGRKFDVE